MAALPPVVCPLPRIVDTYTCTKEPSELLFMEVGPGASFRCGSLPGEYCDRPGPCLSAVAFYSSTPTYVPLEMVDQAGQLIAGEEMDVGWLSVEQQGFSVLVWCRNQQFSTFQMHSRGSAPMLYLPHPDIGGKIIISRGDVSSAKYPYLQHVSPPRALLYQEREDRVPTLKAQVRFTRGERRLLYLDLPHLPAHLGGVRYYQPVVVPQWTIVRAPAEQILGL